MQQVDDEDEGGGGEEGDQIHPEHHIQQVLQEDGLVLFRQVGVYHVCTVQCYKVCL